MDSFFCPELVVNRWYPSSLPPTTLVSVPFPCEPSNFLELALR